MNELNDWDYALDNMNKKRRQQAQDFLDRVGYDFDENKLDLRDSLAYDFVKPEADELIREHNIAANSIRGLSNPYDDVQDIRGCCTTAENDVRKEMGNVTTNSQVDYSKYGDGFSQEFIDKMLADKRFQRALNDYAIPNEGSYVNNPNDSGGETNMGISKRTYPYEDIKNLTRERANAILYRDFWKWNGIHTLPDEIIGVVFDNAINGVPLTAIRNVHQVLGITPGNIIGNETREKIKNIDLERFLADYQELASQQRYELVRKRPKDKIHLNGWLNRINGWHLSPRF